jgi:hypothetical protein
MIEQYLIEISEDLTREQLIIEVAERIEEIIIYIYRDPIRWGDCTEYRAVASFMLDIENVKDFDEQFYVSVDDYNNLITENYEYEMDNPCILDDGKEHYNKRIIFTEEEVKEIKRILI